MFGDDAAPNKEYLRSEVMTQSNFVLPNQIHDIGSLVVESKRWSPKPSVEDLWMAYLVRIPEERTKDEVHAIKTWFFQEIEEWGYDLLR